MATMADGEASPNRSRKYDIRDRNLLGLQPLLWAAAHCAGCGEAANARNSENLDQESGLSASRKNQRCTGRLNATQPEVLPSALVTYVYWAALAREEPQPKKSRPRRFQKSESQAGNSSFQIDRAG
jgi:hypothetical protein